VVSDVFIENYKVGDLRRYGLNYEAIRKINPGIIYCSITGYGQDGPSAHKPVSRGMKATSCSRPGTGKPSSAWAC
jgi:crotonobetainyl-CoA:carnitine CoA-transferase CaiB-like acyl-CoA transferase